MSLDEMLTADVSGIADADGLSNAVYQFQWLADGAEIAGATAASYSLTEAEQGSVVSVRVSFTDDGGYGETLTSAATAAVAAAPTVNPPGPPRNLSGAVNADGTVTLSWRAPAGGTVTGYQILRRRPQQGERGFSVLVADTASAATEFTDTEVSLGQPHIYRVTALNPSGVSPRSNYVRLTPERSLEPTPNQAAASCSGLPRGEAQRSDQMAAQRLRA